MFKKIYIGEKPIKSIYLGDKKIKYNEEVSPPEPPPVAKDLRCHLRGDSAEGGKLKDLSGNGYDFVITGMMDKTADYTTVVNTLTYFDLTKTKELMPESIKTGLFAIPEFTFYMHLIIKDIQGACIISDIGSSGSNLTLTHKGPRVYAKIGSREVPLASNTFNYNRAFWFAMTKDSSGNICGFFKGAPGMSSTETFPPINLDSKALIAGKYGTQASSHILMGELKVFSRVLTNAEIKALKYV